MDTRPRHRSSEAAPEDYQDGTDSLADMNPDAGSLGPARFAGIGAALVGGVLWAIIVAVTG